VRLCARRSGVKTENCAASGPEVRPKRSRVDPGTAGMKQHERIAVAMLLIPGTNTIEQYCCVSHTSFPL
jgi:hypothetical protein